MDRASEGVAATPRLPIGLLAAIGLVAAIEAGVSRLDLDLLTPFQWDWKTAGAAVREATGSDVLCFGDSKLKLAAVPQVVEQRLGVKAFNLAVCAGQAHSSYFLLRRVLESGHRPSAVVVDFFPLYLRSGPWESIELTPHLAGPAECIDLGLAAGSTELLGHLLVAELCPSFRNRQNVRAWVVGALQGRDTTQRYVKARLIRNWRVNRGAQLVPAAELAYDPVEWRRGNFAGTDFNPVALSYVDRFLRLAERHGIPVYWVVLPVAPALRAECRRSGFDADYDRFFADLVARYPGVTLLDGRSSAFADDVFFDPHHLARDGAFAWTHGLCDVLEGRAEELRGPRWVALPPYRRTPIDLPLEDIVASGDIAAGNLRAMRRR